jgi:Tol biopolymer transport system component
VLLRTLVLVPLLLAAVGAPAAPHLRPSARDDIYIVDVATGARHNLTQTPRQPDGAAAWSPDGHSIAYTTLIDPSGDDANLWTTDIRLIDVRAKRGEWFSSRGTSWAGGDCCWARADHGVGFEPRGPAQVWSPDGTKLAYTDLRVTAYPRGGYVGVFVSGTPVTGPAVDAWSGVDPRDVSSVASPSWSPDGHVLVFERTNGAPNGLSLNLYAVRPDGSGEQQVTFQGPWDAPYRTTWFEGWLPDGRVVARERLESMNVWYRCYAVDVDSPAAQETVDCGARSPDGRHTAFAADEGLYVDRRKLTRARVWLATWAPDSRHLAFVRDWRLWVLDAATSRLRQITGDARRREVFNSLSWSPDGTRIAFGSYLARP